MGGDWYHGSPERLSYLHIGSTITQDRDLARVFSHKPTIVSQDVDPGGQRILMHNGQQPGFLYRIAEELKAGDIYPHPETTMGPKQEWLTTREVRVELIAPTHVLSHERLLDADIDALKKRSLRSDGC